MTVLLQRTIRDHLRRSQPEKILDVFQRIHLRFFRACSLASAAPPSPRDEGEGQTESWPYASKQTTQGCV